MQLLFGTVSVCGGEACVCGRASDMNSARVQYWAVGSYADLETRAHVHFLVTLFVNRIPPVSRWTLQLAW